MDCRVSVNATLVQELDALPKMPGESKCFHLMGGTRICRVGVVLGSSLLNNTAVRRGLDRSGTRGRGQLGALQR